MPRVIKPKAIYSVESKGEGVDGDPIRGVQFFHALNGEFIFSYDVHTDEWRGLDNLLEWLLDKGVSREGHDD